VSRRLPRSATTPTSPSGQSAQARGAKRALASPAGARAARFDRTPLRERLVAGLAELGLDASLADCLLDYLALLVKWNGVYNLTAVREPDAMLRQHLLDSLSVVAPLAARLPQRDGAPGGHIIDVGSGAGLPGIVLALAWPRANVVLVEPVGKKAAFLRQCQGELALTNLRVEATRAESLDAPEAGQAPDLVVCRAFASLADFAKAIDRLVGPRTVIAAMKGAAPDAEIAALPAHWTVTEVLPLRVPELDAARHLVLMQRRP
jgi:16S rRNA (guanine527-N7)-methyltransferase